MAKENTSVPFKPLEQNCRENWPLWTCIFGNISGMCSTTLWFIVLLPQLWKNFRRKSVKGLSVLWATANFTASLINLFFVFMYANIPLYGQISSVYCPILEFTLLVQFWMYGRNGRKEKIAYAVGCSVIWASIIVIELLLDIKEYVEYVAIFLWCIETFPQVCIYRTNIKLQVYIVVTFKVILYPILPISLAPYLSVSFSNRDGRNAKEIWYVSFV